MSFRVIQYAVPDYKSFLQVRDSWCFVFGFFSPQSKKKERDNLQVSYEGWLLRHKTMQRDQVNIGARKASLWRQSYFLTLKCLQQSSNKQAPFCFAVVQRCIHRLWKHLVCIAFLSQLFFTVLHWSTYKSAHENLLDLGEKGGGKSGESFSFSLQYGLSY